MRRLNLVAPATVLIIAGCLVGACQGVGPTQTPTSTSPAVSTPTAAPSGTPAPSPSPNEPSASVSVPSPTVVAASPSLVPTMTPAPVGTYAPQPQPSIALPAAGTPALPTHVGFGEGKPCVFAVDVPCLSWGVTWREANATSVTVRVYAVVECLHQPTSSTPIPCLKSGDVIPESSLVLLGSAPAGQGALSFSLQGGESEGRMGFLPFNGPDVFAVLVQAVNASGGSLFAYADVQSTCLCAL